MSDDVTLTVVLSRAGLLLGKLSENKLLKPRIITPFEEELEDPRTGNKVLDPKTGKPVRIPKVNIAPLPGIPPFYRLGADDGHYKFPNTKHNREIYDLYVRVTSPMVDPGEE